MSQQFDQRVDITTIGSDNGQAEAWLLLEHARAVAEIFSGTSTSHDFEDS